jgi:hypothetical protein
MAQQQQQPVGCGIQVEQVYYDPRGGLRPLDHWSAEVEAANSIGSIHLIQHRLLCLIQGFGILQTIVFKVEQESDQCPNGHWGIPAIMFKLMVS